MEIDITAPSTPEAKLWNGWKSHGLKPAYEPVLVAMKPNDGTYSNNALKHGVSGLNIDGCRIEFISEEDKIESVTKNQHKDFNSNNGIRVPTKGIYSGDNRPPENYTGAKGRFPANIILDEEAGRMLDEQTIGKVGNGHWSKTTTKGFGDFGGGESTYEGVGLKDNVKGGASRFFYCAKASKSERNKGCEDLEESKGIRTNAPRDNELTKTPLRKNHHPTVKPIKLMEYLCKLTKTPTGGVVLDPFAGSGTTGLACQNTNRPFILIEREEDFCNIARARIKANIKVDLNKWF